MTWCAEPEVSAARVVWLDSETPGSPSPPSPKEGPEATTSQAETRFDAPGRHGASSDRRPTALLRRAHARFDRAVVSLGTHGRRWPARAPDGPTRLGIVGRPPGRPRRLERRLRAVVGSLRQQVETEAERLRQGKLEALGEFAAGAGHELNNPLAVVVGRAQLLLARASEPEVVRSLRIILNQAQRAHRILRDLMFIARPPAPRSRSCRPSELLASLLRDFERECSARGVRLVADLDPSSPSAWSDPDALRHLAEILLRNALQATPSGGRIQVRSTSNGQRADLVLQRYRQGDWRRRGVPPLRPVLLRATGRPRPGPRPASRRQDRQPGRRPAPLDLESRA